MPVKEAEATNSLIDQGAEVITCHVDGPKTVVENAARRGALVSGYHVNQASLAPTSYLTGAEWNWEGLYPRLVKMYTAGETIPNFYRGGLGEGLVKVSPYGAMVGEAARKHADDVKAKLLAGGYTIFKGPITDNKGKTVIASGVERSQIDPELEKMDYLVEGVIGATS
jgi:simple sugar transport system substrate-binding protein